MQTIAGFAALLKDRFTLFRMEARGLLTVIKLMKLLLLSSALIRDPLVFTLYEQSVRSLLLLLVLLVLSLG